MCRINPGVELPISLINSIISEKEQVANVVLQSSCNLADYQAGQVLISLTGKYGRLSEQVTEQVRRVSDDQLQQWMSKMLTAEILNDLFLLE